MRGLMSSDGVMFECCCCCRDGLEWVKRLVSLVQNLLSTYAWKDVMHKQMSDCIHQLKQVALHGASCSF